MLLHIKINKLYTNNITLPYAIKKYKKYLHLPKD
jgi:hypothetical protein